MLYQLLGWYGVAAILLAYGLVTIERVAVTDVFYILLNGSGALALIVQSYAIRNWQLVVLNVIWFIVALYAVFSVILV